MKRTKARTPRQSTIKVVVALTLDQAVQNLSMLAGRAQVRRPAR